MSEIIALAIGEDIEIDEEAMNAFFSEKGYECIDKDNGMYHNSATEESFKFVVYEQTGYIIFQETENLLPNEVFDFILTLPYDDALISLGEDDGYTTSVNSEMNLNRFKKEFHKAQKEDKE